MCLCKYVNFMFFVCISVYLCTQNFRTNRVHRYTETYTDTYTDFFVYLCIYGISVYFPKTPIGLVLLLHLLVLSFIVVIIHHLLFALERSIYVLYRMDQSRLCAMKRSSELLVKGWKLLNSHCPICHSALMQYASTTHCPGCNLDLVLERDVKGKGKSMF